jgi:hypothetical protein
MVSTLPFGSHVLFTPSTVLDYGASLIELIASCNFSSSVARSKLCSDEESGNFVQGRAGSLKYQCRGLEFLLMEGGYSRPGARQALSCRRIKIFASRPKIIKSYVTFIFSVLPC